MAGSPRFSVIVATYNWSSALRLALESIRAQTWSDFEVLVVGDACTDDSEQVVAALGDARFSWCNLAQRCGSQWGPNNHGLSLARGEYIAYLGHDDLWWPTHLAVAAVTLEKTGADVVAAAALLYGPPESGVRAVSGFFPHGVYSPRIFFPPTSMVHRKDLALRLGGWRSPEQAQVVVDFDFLQRCHAAGARFVATGEITAFKFTAAWHRDAYRKRDAAQQRLHWQRTLAEGEAFRQSELHATLHAAVEGRLRPTEIPTAVAAADFSKMVQEFKGSRRKQPVVQECLGEGKLRFHPEDSYQGFEWHSLEQHPDVGRFRWSGPSTQSTIALPVLVKRALEITLQVVGWISVETLNSARLRINGIDVVPRQIPDGERRIYLRCTVAPEQLAEDDRSELRLTLVVDKTHRAIDLGVGNDSRWLGLAVSWVEIGGLAVTG